MLRAKIRRPRLALAREVERAARELLRERHPGRSLDVNVEFYTAVLLDAVGLDRSAFTPTFATARVAGIGSPAPSRMKSPRCLPGQPSRF